jgi:hypothetical protein
VVLNPYLLLNLATSFFVPPPLPSFADNSEDEEYYATVLRLMLAILCPVVILGIVLAVILLMMRHWHRRRMARLTTMEGSQDPDYTYRDELRVTAAGDSTLRVFKIIIISFYIS